MAKATKRKRDPEKRDKRARQKRGSEKTKVATRHAAAPTVVNPAPEASPISDSPRDATAAVLDRLWNVVTQRRTADPAQSHSARLLGRGIGKVAQKFGEEAVECLIEGVRGDHPALISESADTLYHLIVLWVATGVRPEEVWAELTRREGISGIAEKASRKPPYFTRKIP